MGGLAGLRDPLAWWFSSGSVLVFFTEISDEHLTTSGERREKPARLSCLPGVIVDETAC